MPDPAGVPAPIVHIRIVTAVIRRCFGQEKPPVLTGEWDEAAYVAERRRLYAQTLAGLADVRWAASDLPPEAVPGEEALAWTQVCPDTGDTVHVATGAADPSACAGNTALMAAVQRVLADRFGWRRHLDAGWFERHRAWRARVGSPIQH